MKNVVFKNVTVRYHYDEFDAVSDLSFEVKSGEVVSLVLGEQGGKTTVAKLLMGLVQCTSGEIYADGVLLNEIKQSERRVSYICFPPLAFKTTVKKNISKVLNLRGEKKEEVEKRTQEALTKFGLESVSQKKARHADASCLLKLALARAWAKKTEFFVLDGPMETEAVDEILKTTSELGASALLLCDSASVGRGKIVDFLSGINLSEETK